MKQVSLVSGIILDIALRAALALPLSFWDDACEAATMSDVLIRTATATDEERCWALLALAFSSDPPCRWAWPDSHQYWETFARFAQAFGGRVVDRGTAHYYEGFSGMALRLPPGTTPDEETLVRIIQETALDARKDPAFTMFEQMDAYHPREAHWHLPLTGVDPASQGKGIASALSVMY